MAGDEAGVTLGQPHLSRQDLATLVRPARGAPRGRGEAAAGGGAELRRMRALGAGGAWRGRAVRRGAGAALGG